MNRPPWIIIVVRLINECSMVQQIAKAIWGRAHCCRMNWADAIVEWFVYIRAVLDKIANERYGVVLAMDNNHLQRWIYGAW